MISAQPVHARRAGRADQTVEVIVDHGYRPQSIVARAGLPLRLVFHRRDDDPCMDRVVFSSPHLDRRLARDAATTITLPAQSAGEIRFACGMGRYHGQIELRAEAPSALAGVRAAAADALGRGWRLVRGPVPATVEETPPTPSEPGLPAARSQGTSPNVRAHARTRTTRETTS